MNLDALLERVSDSAQDIVQSLQSGEPLSNLALRRSARLPVLAALHKALDRPILLITDRTDRALTQFDELALLSPTSHRLFFPEPNPLFYENSDWGETTRRDRLLTLTNLAAYHLPGNPLHQGHPIIVAPARAIMTRTIPRRDFLKAIQILKLGQTVSLDRLVHSLVDLRYQPTTTVISPGQFARRGGIIDLWIPAENFPSRIEFFGDELDTIRQFDPSSQRTLPSQKSNSQLLVTPAREFIATSGSKDDGDEGQQVFNEFYIPQFHLTPASILDFLPRHALVMIDNWEDFSTTVHEVEEQAVGLRQDFIEDGSLPPTFPLPYLTWAELQDSLSSHQCIQLGPAGGEEKTSLTDRFSPGPRFGGRLKPLLEHINQMYTAGVDLYIVSRQASRLNELWTEQPYLSSEGPGSVIFIDGSLTEGWTFSPVSGPSAQLLTDGEIFGWRRPEPRQRHRATATAPETAYADLQPGDWVVHVDHGIGSFLGLVNRTVDGIEREYLAVEYAEGDQLFVPVHQADRLTRYISHDNRIPSPSRLGSQEWRQTKSRVKEAVEEVASELLELYSQRQVVQGFAFSKDTSWQQELEASFPYIETEDQLRVIQEVKRDMESERPMDRLICGDVGYGKTEVALRAAFKAVMDGKQVALLVPTTVLAQQHFNTFHQRLAAYPVEVEMLSRFRTTQQQRDILFRLSLGTIDIIIGTHRLLQSDVQFKDLGLLIIDEEQRFGVTHKEYLKQKRTEVDVLTLTATPIPRTLYMALTGVRDISTINTPPEERLPIVTHVGPYSKRLVRQAILRELERGGQVFFVHNRVQTIPILFSHLERLVPEARIAIAHGQMPENELARRMDQFTSGEIDVLLSTSIIESGLDIPNANTLIVDRADAFGLAQLYQLRGRVGRGAQRAYVYFFKHPRRTPSIDGRQRLETVSENTQLGAGFSIAMRDLEIRGTGDILGTRQHGHLASVGFHLYTRLLADAVSRLRAGKGLPPDPNLEKFDVKRLLVNVDLPWIVGIPPEYVGAKNMRLKLYRRIADLRSLAEVDALQEEFTDRFGDPSEPVRNLLFQMKIKILAEKADLVSISVESDQIVLRFRDGETPRDLPPLNEQARIGKTAVWIPYNNDRDWSQHLVDILDKLVMKAQSA
jgi:transcription-repair coupling factor (superfamily II helicase)